MKQKSVRLFSEKHLENIGSNFKNLFEDEVLTDLTLYCKDGSIKVHKLVLAASSSYFRQVFTTHSDKPAVFYMYGISLMQLKNLVELMYKGSINLPTDNFNSVYGLAEELQIAGLLVDGLNERATATPAPCTRIKDYSRDTRFKGQKRVSVDFNGVPVIQSVTTVRAEQESVTATCVQPEIKQEKPDPPVKPTEPALVERQENQSYLPDDIRSNLKDESSSSKSTDLSMDESADEKPGLSSWEKAERKYQCNVCNSSFKRASHLSRHQLVHTGERPFACDHCHKAFSRHDKLKHHIQKAHESESIDPLPADALYTIGHVQILNPNELYQSVDDYTYDDEDDDVTEVKQGDIENPTPKKRGRPRKYPIVPKPKGPRGRPRIKPLVPKGPRGRPRINPIGTPHQQQHPSVPADNYDLSNMPFGDLSYLTKSVDQTDEIMDLDDEPEFIEPLVEIQVEPQAKVSDSDPQQNFMHNIGLLETTVGKIGECTISVAPNGN